MTRTEVFQQIILPILISVVTGIAGYFGGLLRKKVDKWADNDAKREIAETCVAAIEQMHHELSGTEKKAKAIKAMHDMAEAKGIPISEFEIEMFIEAAVGKFNDAFNKPRKNTAAAYVEA